MNILLYILLLIFSALLLIKSSAWSVTLLSKAAGILKWSPFFIAFILMGFATTLPELLVGISSALHNSPELSFGNVLGSNVINLTLLAGLGALVGKGLILKSKQARKGAFRMLVFALAPILLFLDQYLSRLDGLVLISLLVLHLSNTYYKKRKKLAKNQKKRHLPRSLINLCKNSIQNLKTEYENYKNLLKTLLFFSLSFGVLALSAEGVVFAGIHLAQKLNLPAFLIGVVLIALGTNLPEISFGIRAIKMHYRNMVLGNLMGAVIINSTLVLGITAIIKPFPVPYFSNYLLSIAFLFFSALFFYFFSHTNTRISRKEGIILIFIYLLFLIGSLVLN